ncbi:LIM domain-binding protein 2-like, partial [Diadema antillarum]|uniref:LIM domain-binding protein 2-like n=1 Tax=Diadema antillarum TaxID=105358 RepID=UPI003A86720A
YHSQDPTMLEQLSKNITRQGLTNVTLNYLRLCVILEPMQELMSRHKVYNLSPRDCLKATLFQKWQHTNRPQPKRRKRKSSTTMNPTGGNSMPMNNIGGGNSKKKSPGGFSSDGMPTDVMVVGEPSLMGGEFGDEDERLITRLENTQCDTNNGMDNEEDFAAGGDAAGAGQGPGGPKSATSSSGPGQGSWNSTDTKPPPGTNPSQDDKQVAASQN